MQQSSLRFDKKAKDNTIFLTERVTERVMKFRSFIFISYLKEHVSNNRQQTIDNRQFLCVYINVYDIHVYMYKVWYYRLFKLKFKIAFS